MTLSAYASAAGIATRSGAERESATPTRVRWVLAAALATAVAGLVIFQPWRDVQVYATGVGKRQVVVLRDGTRMSLNTGTRVKAELTSTQRTVLVDGGEALFEVAKDAQRPFVVRAAGSEVVALGTVFSVRLTPDGAQGDNMLAVTLIEGTVTVRSLPRAAVHEGEPLRPLLLQRAIAFG